MSRKYTVFIRAGDGIYGHHVECDYMKHEAGMIAFRNWVQGDYPQLVCMFAPGEWHAVRSGFWDSKVPIQPEAPTRQKARPGRRRR